MSDDNEHKQPHARHLKLESLQPEKEEKKEFNHLEYAKMITKQLREKKKNSWQDVTDKKDSDKRPLLVASKEQLEDRKINPKGHKGRIK